MSAWSPALRPRTTQRRLRGRSAGWPVASPGASASATKWRRASSAPPAAISSPDRCSSAARASSDQARDRNVQGTSGSSATAAEHARPVVVAGVEQDEAEVQAERTPACGPVFYLVRRAATPLAAGSPPAPGRRGRGDQTLVHRRGARPPAGRPGRVGSRGCARAARGPRWLHRRCGAGWPGGTARLLAMQVAFAVEGADAVLEQDTGPRRVARPGAPRTTSWTGCWPPLTVPTRRNSSTVSVNGRRGSPPWRGSQKNPGVTTEKNGGRSAGRRSSRSSASNRYPSACLSAPRERAITPSMWVALATGPCSPTVAASERPS